MPKVLRTLRGCVYLVDLATMVNNNMLVAMINMNTMVTVVAMVTVSVVGRG